MPADWSSDPKLAAVQRRREQGPRIAAHADTNGLAPEDMTDVDCARADLETDPIISVQREKSDLGTRYSIDAAQYEPRGDGTARRRTREEVLELARRQCHAWIAADLGIDLADRPELAHRLEPRDLGNDRVGLLVDEVLRKAFTTR